MPASQTDTCLRVPPSHPETGSDDWRKLEEWKQQKVEEWKRRHLEEWKQRYLSEWSRQPEELKQKQLQEWSLRHLKALKQQNEKWTEVIKPHLDETTQRRTEEWKQLNLKESQDQNLEEWKEHEEEWNDSQLTTEPLPFDPREWTRAHVRRWLREAAARHGLAVRASRFLMNGKALCLMTREMYARRVPGGGALLHGDFRRRLARALSA